MGDREEKTKSTAAYVKMRCRTGEGEIHTTSRSYEPLLVCFVFIVLHLSRIKCSVCKNKVQSMRG